MFDKLLNMTADLAVVKIHDAATVLKFNKLPLMSKGAALKWTRNTRQ